MIPVITEVTRISTKEKDDRTTTTSKTLIDNIFIKANKNHISEVIDTTISDHFSVFVSLPLISKDTIQNTQIKFRLINDFTKRKFNCQLLQSNITDILNERNGKVGLSKFYKTCEPLIPRNPIFTLCPLYRY